MSTHTTLQAPVDPAPTNDGETESITRAQFNELIAQRSRQVQERLGGTLGAACVSAMEELAWEFSQGLQPRPSNGMGLRTLRMR